MTTTPKKWNTSKCLQPKVSFLFGQKMALLKTRINKYKALYHALAIREKCPSLRCIEYMGSNSLLLQLKLLAKYAWSKIVLAKNQRYTTEMSRKLRILFSFAINGNCTSIFLDILVLYLKTRPWSLKRLCRCIDLLICMFYLSPAIIIFGINDVAVVYLSYKKILEVLFEDSSQIK
ncbi:hypothetical protein EGR_05307 [Echinococcus granulosus]|uniref:Uncharacterized protein n=1 Tax=Echinococcus granulosus TaxID=6210 RepID=W6UFU9_ECHGR|nr:hypothetical protein EGR_05307 [Echinococcus granulosus]EUB59831.1 hypothetical protein EGR_05307 [Echinococcus granulosus]